MVGLGLGDGDPSPPTTRRSKRRHFNGVPIKIHHKEKVYVSELIFRHLLTSSNYVYWQKKTAGGCNAYGSKPKNIFSMEFVIYTANDAVLQILGLFFFCLNVVVS